MDNKNTEKKILGSVAVDSQTGMEHYQVPKAVQTDNSDGLQHAGESGDPLRPGFQTPNYGENGDSGKDQNLAGVSEEFLHLFEHDPSEAIVYQATRHPIGAITIFAMGGIAAFLIIVAFVFFVSDASFFSSVGMNSTNATAVGSLVAIVLLAVIAAVTFLSSYIYKKSRIILTNQKVVLIQYHSLIAREVSQLNIGEVEDVNVSQPTLLDRIFKTGRITIETAGEQNNYVLTQVENPYEFAKLTIQMHEGSIAEYGN